MGILKSLKVSLFLFIAMQSILVQTAEESKESDDLTDITTILNSQAYRPIKEGFDILHNMDQSFNTTDQKIPTLEDYLKENLVQDENEETNMAQVIQNAHDIISNAMKKPFTRALYNQMENLYAHEYKDTPKDPHIVPTVPKRKEYKSYTTIFDFNEIKDPLFQYVMKYKDTFMHPIIREWVETDCHISEIRSMQFYKIDFLTIFQNAIKYNCLPIIIFLLDMEINTNVYLSATKLSPTTPLGDAVFFQRSEIVQLLLEHGAKTDVRVSTPYLQRLSQWEPILIEAAKYDDITIIEMLLKYNVQVNQQNVFGKTALLIATQRNNKELVKILLAAHADPNISDKLQNGYTIDIAENSDKWHGWYIQNPYDNHLAKSLANFNTDTTDDDIYGQTPLIMATRNNSIDIVKMLIEAGANLNTTNIFYGTALQIAQRNNYTEIQDALLQAGAIEYTPAQRIVTDEKYKDLPLPPLDGNECYDKTDPFIFDAPKPNKRKAQDSDEDHSDHEYGGFGRPIGKKEKRTKFTIEC